VNSKERILAALNHIEPDRVPVDFGGTIVSTIHERAYNNLKEYLGIKTPHLKGSGPSRKVVVETGVLERLDIDTRFICTRAPNVTREISDENGYYRNEWGVEYRIPAGVEEYCYVPQKVPLAEAATDDIEVYDWPDPRDKGRTAGLAEEAALLHEEKRFAIIGNVDKPSIFELALAMRGFERFLLDLAERNTFSKKLLEKITELQIIRYAEMLEAAGKYLDVVVYADDVGTQHGLLLSPEVYREMLKPLHKALYDAIRAGSDAKIFYHCCGDCFELIGDFIEIGVDILNPVQVSAANMGPERLKREFGKHLTFWGAMDTQHVLPHGTAEEVRENVRKMAGELGKDGGFVLSPVHNVVDDVPPENIAAMYEGCLRLRRGEKVR